MEALRSRQPQACLDHQQSGDREHVPGQDTRKPRSFTAGAGDSDEDAVKLPRDVGFNLDNLGLDLRAQGKFGGRSCPKRGITIMEKSLGVDHPEVAETQQPGPPLRYARQIQRGRGAAEARAGHKGEAFGADKPTWPQPGQPGKPIQGARQIRRSRGAVETRRGDLREVAG